MVLIQARYNIRSYTHAQYIVVTAVECETNEFRRGFCTLVLSLGPLTLVIWPIFLTVTIHGMVTLILNSLIHSIIMLILLDTFALSMVHHPF